MEDLKSRKPRRGKVKVWTGIARQRGKEWEILIAATSIRQALELMIEAGFGYMGAHHFKNYFISRTADAEQEIGVWGKLAENRYTHDEMKRLL